MKAALSTKGGKVKNTFTYLILAFALSSCAGGNSAVRQSAASTNEEVIVNETPTTEEGEVTIPSEVDQATGVSIEEETPVKKTGSKSKSKNKK